MLNGTLVFRVNSPLVGTICSQNKKFVMGVRIKAKGDLKLNDTTACKSPCGSAKTLESYKYTVVTWGACALCHTAWIGCAPC